MINLEEEAADAAEKIAQVLEEIVEDPYLYSDQYRLERIGYYLVARYSVVSPDLINLGEVFCEQAQRGAKVAHDVYC